MVTFLTHEYPKKLPDNSTYLCACEDTCENGRYHGHEFICFKNQSTLPIDLDQFIDYKAITDNNLQLESKEVYIHI